MKKLYYYINTTSPRSSKKLPKYPKKKLFFVLKVPIFIIEKAKNHLPASQALKNILLQYKNHRNNHLVNTTPRGRIKGLSKPACSMTPTRKNSAIPLKSINLCKKYIVMGFIPITMKKNAHFLYPFTSIIQ